MIRLGLCSGACITRDIPGIISVALGAKLDAIEWAADIHVVAEDGRAAEETMIATLTAGLTVASYSSIYCAGSEDEGRKRFGTLVAAASIMQAPILRIYAAPVQGHQAALVAELKELGDLVAARGITLCLSCGRKTALDGYGQACSLIKAVGHDFVKLAWEDLPGTPSATATEALEELGNSAGALVALSTGRDGRPKPMAAETEAWRRRLAAFKRAEKEPEMGRFVLLGAPRAEGAEGEASLAADAQSLRSLVSEIEPKRRR